MATLTSDAVYEILHDCLFTEEEAAGLGIGPGAKVADFPDSEQMRVVSGIVASFGMHPGRLESHREQVHAMLEELPIQFRTAREGGGGGWSFLNMCMTKDDVQWTGMHSHQEGLACLAIGLGLGRWVPRSRDLWVIFPGAMPYFEWGDDLERNITITDVPLPEPEKEEASEHGT